MYKFLRFDLTTRVAGRCTRRSGAPGGSFETSSLPYVAALCASGVVESMIVRGCIPRLAPLSGLRQDVIQYPELLPLALLRRTLLHNGLSPHLPSTPPLCTSFPRSLHSPRHPSFDVPQASKCYLFCSWYLSCHGRFCSSKSWPFCFERSVQTGQFAA